MNWLDYRDPRPIYEQIADHYKTLILKGVLKPGERLPSVRSLAVELSTNPNTVQKAYAQLERDGFIYTVKGRGNYVGGGEHLLECRKEELAEELTALFKEARELGIDCGELIELAGGLDHD